MIEDYHLSREGLPTSSTANPELDWRLAEYRNLEKGAVAKSGLWRANEGEVVNDRMKRRKVQLSPVPLQTLIFEEVER